MDQAQGGGSMSGSQFLALPGDSEPEEPDPFPEPDREMGESEADHNRRTIELYDRELDRLNNQVASMRAASITAIPPTVALMKTQVEWEQTQRASEKLKYSRALNHNSRAMMSGLDVLERQAKMQGSNSLVFTLAGMAVLLVCAIAAPLDLVVTLPLLFVSGTMFFTGWGASRMKKSLLKTAEEYRQQVEMNAKTVDATIGSN